MTAEALGRGPGEVLAKRGDIDAVVDCLLNRVWRFDLCPTNSPHWFGHTRIVASLMGDIKEDPAGGGWAT
jgi:hypothetical protein